MRSPLVIAVSLVAALVVGAAVWAAPQRSVTLEPRERVRGMLVVQGLAPGANTALFGIYCEPAILKSGRYRRTCGRVPAVKRLFVGYGWFAPTRTAISRAWAASRWSMWIDGEPVSLDEFGYADRTLYSYAPAGGRDVILREWSITLVQPPPGRHTIRYRIRNPELSIDATWEFTVTR